MSRWVPHPSLPHPTPSSGVPLLNETGAAAAALLERCEAAEADAVVVREGHWDELVTERDQLREELDLRDAERAFLDGQLGAARIEVERLRAALRSIASGVENASDDPALEALDGLYRGIAIATLEVAP